MDGWGEGTGGSLWYSHNICSMQQSSNNEGMGDEAILMYPGLIGWDGPITHTLLMDAGLMSLYGGSLKQVMWGFELVPVDFPQRAALSYPYTPIFISSKLVLFYCIFELMWSDNSCGCHSCLHPPQWPQSLCQSSFLADSRAKWWLQVKSWTTNKTCLLSNKNTLFLDVHWKNKGK